MLEALLARAQRTHPFIAEFSVGSKGSLAIGLASDHTVLSFTAESKDPPYLHSRGGNDEGADLVFFYDGHWTEFPSEQAVDTATGVDAVRHFLSTGSLPQFIDWEET